MKKAAADALGELGESVLWCEYGLNKPDPEIRQAMAVNPRYTDDARAVPILTTLLDDADAVVREQAVESLRRIGGDEAEKALRAVGQQPSPAKTRKIGGVVIGCGFTPSQAHVQDVMRSGHLKNCTTITTGSFPFDIDEETAAFYYIRCENENGWEEPPQGLERIRLNMSEGRTMWPVYPRHVA